MTAPHERERTPMAALKFIGRVLVLLALAAGMIAVWMNRGVLDPATITAAIAHQPLAPLIFLGAHVLASLLFVPRTVLGLVAGLVFGLVWGLVWAVLGSVLGAVAGFLVARYVNGGLIDLEHLPRIGPILLRAEAGGWRAVTMIRLVPVFPHSLTNYALGLTQLSLGGYTVGSLLGQLPMTVAYVGFGAAGGQIANGTGGWIAPIAIGAVALAASILVPRWHARRQAPSA